MITFTYKDRLGPFPYAVDVAIDVDASGLVVTIPRAKAAGFIDVRGKARDTILSLLVSHGAEASVVDGAIRVRVEGVWFI